MKLISDVVLSPDHEVSKGRRASLQATHIEFSLYAIPNSLLITPNVYSSYPIMEMDASNNPVLAVRELDAGAPGEYVIENAFNWVNPPPVQDVRSSTSNR